MSSVNLSAQELSFQTRQPQCLPTSIMGSRERTRKKLSDASATRKTFQAFRKRLDFIIMSATLLTLNLVVFLFSVTPAGHGNMADALAS